MKKVHVNASREYDVLIGRGILDNSGEFIASVKNPSKIAIITDSVVSGLYLDRVVKSLSKLSCEIVSFIFKNGEQSKNINVYSDILEFLAENELSRTDMILALGGGVVGDMAGFAAATYLRGIDFIQIPTTFLAAIDSSVGGKTAIDLRAGKNLCGAFYQPSLVICDCETLDTLSDEIFADGSAEAIKYGMLRDTRLMKYFEEGIVKENIEDIIFECVSIKRDIVNADEYDRGMRQILNLGHTFGHSIEKLSDFSVSHGHAVAIGTAIVARLSESLGKLSKSDREKLEKILLKNNLQIATDYDKRSIALTALLDKKRNGNTINFILPVRIGESEIYKVGTDEIENLLSEEILRGH
ncbi:MAG: 3-dehydroquinate synthase [Eubacteriales bacterium]|nr:3-dehydroquinate synthase [Eubacteriales bacterium]